jgi:hypothetical protein
VTSLDLCDADTPRRLAGTVDISSPLLCLSTLHKCASQEKGVGVQYEEGTEAPRMARISSCRLQTRG